MNPTPFQQFLLDEMKRRDMSHREFAKFIGVSQPTISRALDFKSPAEPTTQFIIKLARATHHDPCMLLGLLYPDDVGVNAQARMISERIERLPPDLREIVDNFLLSLAFRKNKNSGDIQ